MTTNKTCPFRPTQYLGITNINERKCDQHNCQLWVKLEKDRILVLGKHSRMPDPDAKYIYEGCGLVTAIPWILVKEVKNK